MHDRQRDPQPGGNRNSSAQGRRNPSASPMNRKLLTAEQRESHRKANREYAARKKASDTAAARSRHRADWERRKHRRNEDRRAKHDRDWNRQRRAQLRAVLNIWADKHDTASIVEGNAIRDDLTTYRGPGWRKERRLEAQANTLLAAAARKEAPPKNEHLDPQAPDHPR